MLGSSSQGRTENGKYCSLVLVGGMVFCSLVVFEFEVVVVRSRRRAAGSSSSIPRKKRIVGLCKVDGDSVVRKCARACSGRSILRD